MLGLILAIVVFNIIAFLNRKPLSKNSIVHIWLFTIAFQQLFDIMIDFHYHGYWYFTKEVDWRAIPAHLALLPPVNMLFVRFYPFDKSFSKRFFYYVIWDACLVGYELLTLLPAPWGYFHYGWWHWWFSALLNLFLLLSLIVFYKWVGALEKHACRES